MAGKKQIQCEGKTCGAVGSLRYMRLLDGIINKALFQFYNLLEPKPEPIEPATPQLVAKRFRQLFVDHGIEVTQIPRVFPEITLDDLKSNNSLLKKLSTECIDKVAEFFKVRVEWLEGKVVSTKVNTTFFYYLCNLFFRVN